MAQKPSKLVAAILAHLATITDEEAEAFYGVPIKTIKVSKRTKRPTGAMMEAFIEHPPDQPAGAEPEPGPEAPPAAAGVTLPVDDLLNHPIIQAIVEKLNEVVAKNGELIAELEGDAIRIGELETVVTMLYRHAQGIPATMAQPNAPIVAPLGTPPPANDGGFLQPELIGSLRPGRSAVPVIRPNQSFPAAPAAAQVVGTVPPPIAPANRRSGLLAQLALAPTVAEVAEETHRADTGSIKEGTAFDWLRPHAAKK